MLVKRTTQYVLLNCENMLVRFLSRIKKLLISKKSNKNDLRTFDSHKNSKKTKFSKLFINLMLLIKLRLKIRLLELIKSKLDLAKI